MMITGIIGLGLLFIICVGFDQHFPVFCQVGLFDC